MRKFARTLAGLGHFWLDEIERNFMVAFVIVVWCINASFNYAMGTESGGMALGLALVAVALLGAWGASQAKFTTGGMKAFMVTMTCIQLVVGQLAGWQSLGISLSRGAATLDDKASQRQTVVTKLDNARKERAQIGVTEPIETLVARERLECSRTSKQFPDGVGPACTEWRAKLGNARRAADLDKQIVTLTEQLGAAPKVKSGSVLYEVPMAISEALIGWWRGEKVTITTDDVRFWWLVLLVAVLEFVATLGFWATGVGSAPPAARPDVRTGAGGRASQDFFGDVLGGEMALAGGGFAPVSFAMAGAPPSYPASRPIPIGVERQLAPPPRRERLAAGPEVLPPDRSAGGSGGGGTGGGATAHGAPVTINIGGLGAREGVTDITPQPVATPRRGEAPAMPPRHDVGAVDDAPPVDRSAINEINDNLLAFRAACVVGVTGGHVTADNMYRRYVAWRGVGALGPEAFHALFPAVAGLDRAEVAGQMHYHGVTLRAPSLAAVGG